MIKNYSNEDYNEMNDWMYELNGIHSDDSLMDFFPTQDERVQHIKGSVECVKESRESIEDEYCEI